MMCTTLKMDVPSTGERGTTLLRILPELRSRQLDSAACGGILWRRVQLRRRAEHPMEVAWRVHICEGVRLCVQTILHCVVRRHRHPKGDDLSSSRAPWGV